MKEAEEESSGGEDDDEDENIEVNTGEIVKYRVSGKWELQSANIG